MKGYKHATAEQRAQVPVLFRQGMDVKMIGEALSITADQVRTWLKKSGMKPPRSKGGACYQHRELLLRMAADGASLRKIGFAVGTRPAHVKRFLVAHGIIFVRHGQSHPGGLNPAWNGGRKIDKDGYVLIHSPQHPFATADGCVREHRLVMEKKIGRYLLPTEVVHHEDDDPQNNDPDNLTLYASNGEHLHNTISGQVPNWTEEGKKRILESVRRPRKRKQTSTPGETSANDCQ